MADTLLTCTEALNTVAAQMRTLVPPLQTERVALEKAHGRVLAADLQADRDQPPFPRSTRDGYALRAADIGAEIRLIGAIRAGEEWTGPTLNADEAIEIMTGAPAPAGADAIAMLEHVQVEDGRIRLQGGRTLKPGENIVPRGAEARAGDTVLHAGTRMGPAEIALAASIGAAEAPMYCQPAVAILSTGDELVDVRAMPGPMQIRNSNAPGLAALVRENGGVPLLLPPVADTRAALRQAIEGACDAEMLVLTGGVSAGRYDLVEEVLAGFGAEFFFTGAKIQPGKPVVFGRIPPRGNHRGQWVFGLPGNPVSTQVTALLFAMPMLRALGGEAHAAPWFAHARLSEAVAVRPGLTRFLPARMDSDLEGARIKPTGWQGSGDLHSNARANCYAVVPPQVESLAAGEMIAVLLR